MNLSLSRRARTLLASLAIVGGAVALNTPVAEAAGSNGAVYVLGNQTSGNNVLVFARDADGTLGVPVSVSTGGNGTGGGLGSQGAIVLDQSGRHLYAVNAGSNTITSFRVHPNGLERVDVVNSGGVMPTSIAVDDDLVYVLNAGGAGSISGFNADDGDLAPLAGSTRALSGPGAAPAQVSFTPNGEQLIVTERATRKIDVYAVGADGLATGPTVVDSVGVTPFGFGFDNKDHLIVSEAFGGGPDASAVSSYDVGEGALSPVSESVPTTETAACWIAVANSGRFAFAGNAGGSVSAYAVAPDGTLTLRDSDGRTAAPGAGVTDLAVSRNSQFLYGRLGNGSVAAWAIGNDGSLTDLGHQAGLPLAGAAGIAAA
jgi:6-phosphogluconolactonase (cycloisomerase 2 family)